MGVARRGYGEAMCPTAPGRTGRALYEPRSMCRADANPFRHTTERPKSPPKPPNPMTKQRKNHGSAGHWEPYGSNRIPVQPRLSLIPEELRSMTYGP